MAFGCEVADWIIPLSPPKHIGEYTLAKKTEAAFDLSFLGYNRNMAVFHRGGPAPYVHIKGLILTQPLKHNFYFHGPKTYL